MGKSNGALGAIGKVITYILVVLLILGIVGIAGYFLLREQGMTYYVEYNGQRYMGGMDGGSLVLQTGKPHEFFVGSLTGEEVNYSVKVTANKANNFGFYVGEEFQRFYSEDDDEVNDYSQEFGLQKNADGFSLTMPEDYTVEKALEDKYGGEVWLKDELSGSTAYFVITVAVEKTSLNLWFIFGAEVTGITLDPPHIIFGGNGAIADDDPDDGGELPDNPDGERYAIGWDTLSLGANCLVSVDIPSDAAAGELVTVTVIADDSVGEVTRVVLCDEDGEDIEDLEQSNGVYTFVMPAHEVYIMIYCVENGY